MLGIKCASYDKIRQILGWDEIDLYGVYGYRIGKPLTASEKACVDAFRVEPEMTPKQQAYKNLDDLFARKLTHVSGIVDNVGKEQTQEKPTLEGCNNYLRKKYKSSS
ncbi:MAG: hypothetical protein EX285_03305 [Thaumarchaeota archaeon]|nr:hypothetical protein [Nitrososphaerota archaeon]